jgi:hypothetical protein
VETGKAESVAFTLIVDDTKERLYLTRDESTKGERTYSWTAANERQIGEIAELVESIRKARYLALEPMGSPMRDEFSTRNAATALNGLLQGCEAMEHEQAKAQPPAAMPVRQQPPLPAPSSVPAITAATFGSPHLSAIIEAAQTNAARFARDYKGKSFRAQVMFLSLQDGFFGQKQLIGQVGPNSIQCFGRSDLEKAAIDWRIGETITVSGVIDDTVLGSLMLDPCMASK